MSDLAGSSHPVNTYRNFPTRLGRPILPAFPALTAIGQAIARQWFSFLLAGLVLLWYAPSVQFGLIWDDPLWYQQGAGRSFWELLTSLSTYQFYRPLAIWLNQQLVSPDGVVNVALAHLIQIGAHTAVLLITVPLLQMMGFREWQARLTALLLAVHPFAYQAVAWQAPQQPLATMFVLLSALTAAHFAQSGRRWLLALSLATYVAGLFFQESVLPFAFVFPWLAWTRRQAGAQRRLALWPLLHLALALAFALVWLQVPRADGITGVRFQPIVLGYLLQALAFPLAAGIASAGTSWPLGVQIGLYLGLGVLLALALQRARQGRVALFSGLWIAAGILPVWMGLSWEYVQVGSRLAYPALLGIAALWGGCAASLLEARRKPSRQLLGALVLVVLMGVSLVQWRSFERLYQVGTRHLAHAVSAMSLDPERHTLWVNFPDRIELRSRPYPLGFWGLTLAPVVQDMSDYALAATGQHANTRSIAHFATGADDREAWPYQVDMRGEDTQGDPLYAALDWADAVYITDYLPDGSLRLRHVGSLSQSVPSRVLASFGGRLQLADAEIIQGPGAPTPIRVRLTWRATDLMALGDTIFVHLLTDQGQYITGCDGDSLGELWPLSAWTPASTVHDEREIATSDLPTGRYMVTVGAYNRETGTRYPATQANGLPVYNDEYVIAFLDITAP
ncbi:MAG: hypothetical protein GX552_03945 [Chloroflexi bacterium]|jgi:hypothetical protein|nr:hypothetical protein [Chloroflexota bacterium]